jgi:hypothetical protein
MQILSSATASQRSIIDKRTESLGTKECIDATNGHATKRTNNYHKSNATDGELE